MIVYRYVYYGIQYGILVEDSFIGCLRVYHVVLSLSIVVISVCDFNLLCLLVVIILFCHTRRVFYLTIVTFPYLLLRSVVGILRMFILQLFFFSLFSYMQKVDVNVF